MMEMEASDEKMDEARCRLETKTQRISIHLDDA